MKHREAQRAGAFPHVAARTRPRAARGAAAWYRTAAALRAALRAALLASLLVACAQGTPGPGQNQPPGNVPPTASFTATPSEGAAPLVVAFDATASTDPDGSLTLYAWDFGDGSAGTGATTTHTYATPGSYEARLSVTDDAGATASASRTIVVTGDPVVGGERFEALDIAYQAGELAFNQPGLRIIEAIDYALLALQRGAQSLSGTLKEASPGAFTYSAQPSDRLRVEFLNGHTWEATFHVSPVGNDASGNAFYYDSHTIDVTVVTNAAAGALDLRISSSSTGGTQTGRVVGGFDDAAGHRWTIDVTHEDFRKYEGVGEGFQDDRRIFAQGAVASPSRGITVGLSRTYVYENVNFAEGIDHRYDQEIGWGGKVYRLQGRAKVGLFKTKPNNEHEWIVSGSLTENGATIGEFTSTEDAQGLSVWLQIGAERFKMLVFTYSRN